MLNTYTSSGNIRWCLRLGFAKCCHDLKSKFGGPPSPETGSRRSVEERNLFVLPFASFARFGSLIRFKSILAGEQILLFSFNRDPLPFQFLACLPCGVTPSERIENKISLISEKSNKKQRKLHRKACRVWLDAFFFASFHVMPVGVVVPTNEDV